MTSKCNVTFSTFHGLHTHNKLQKAGHGLGLHKKATVYLLLRNCSPLYSVTNVHKLPLQENIPIFSYQEKAIKSIIIHFLHHTSFFCVIQKDQPDFYVHNRMNSHSSSSQLEKRLLQPKGQSPNEAKYVT